MYQQRQWAAGSSKQPWIYAGLEETNKDQQEFSALISSLGLFIPFGNEHWGLRTCPKRGQGGGKKRRGGENLSLCVGPCQSREPGIRHGREWCFFTHLSSESDGSVASPLFISDHVSHSHEMVAVPVYNNSWTRERCSLLHDRNRK